MRPREDLGDVVHDPGFGHIHGDDADTDVCYIGREDYGSVTRAAQQSFLRVSDGGTAGDVLSSEACLETSALESIRHRSGGG